jgi:homoserine O-acetyltransferase/O-succinyltransferase
MIEEQSWLNLSEDDFKIAGFQFASGETLDELTIRYTTLGTPQRDPDGEISNAVLLIHNTTGSGRTWLQPSLADELFGDGQALDLQKYFVVVPDMVGFGGSSKPSDGMRARFPHYRYEDMVNSTHRLLTECLGIRRLKLLLGISMGGMLAWIYGAKYPDFVETLVPVASQPGPMSGRNWIQRRVSIEAIRNDPDWNNGDYETNPTRYVLTAPFSGLLIQSVVRLQEKAPTREAGDALYRTLVERAKKGDANDRLYQVEASMDYDPSGDLDRIKARLLAINFEDDELNPPQLGTVEPAIDKIPGAQYVLVPAGKDTNGHYSTMLAHLWARHLEAFLTGAR